MKPLQSDTHSNEHSAQLRALHFDAHNPLKLARFWAEALGWKVNEETSGKVELVPTDGTRFTIIFLPTSEKKQGANRLHLDLTTVSLEDQTQTVENLVEIGARHIDIGQRPEEGHVVLADPEGNELCIIGPDNTFLAGTDRLGSITCDGTREVGYFWSKVLGWPLVWDQDEETAIRAPDNTGPLITWGGPPVAQKTGKNRLYLDIAPSPLSNQKDEVERLISLGARRAETPQGADGRIAMIDPDGNEFYILAT